MFTAIVFACHAVMVNACFQLVDDRGPYLTEQRCVVRVQEMIKDTIKIWNDNGQPVDIKGWKCEVKNVST